MGQLKRPRFNWEAVIEEMQAMRADKKSLADIADYIEFRHGVRFTRGRLSQVLKQFREKEVNAN